MRRSPAAAGLVTPLPLSSSLGAPLRLALRLPLCLLLSLLLTGCVTPATSSEQYQAKALATVEAVASEVATVEIVVALLLEGRILVPYADRTISSAEVAISTIGDTLGSVQPPDDPGSDAVRADVAAVVQEAEDAVADARIATRRSDVDGLRAAGDALAGVAAGLDEAEAALS
jgi:hypothetical protein